MSTATSLASLAEDLNEIKTYLTTRDNLCQATVKSFLTRYDVLGSAPLIRASSALFKDHELLEALLDNWEGLLEPTSFVKFIYAFCLIEDKTVTYTLFLESGGSTEVLRAMDTNVKEKELIFYGAKCLAVLSSNEELRSSLSEGDAISLVVDSLHAHKKEKDVMLVLLLVLVNLLYQNPDSKKAFVESNGIPITCSIISMNHTQSRVLQLCFHLLRHIAADKSTRNAEAKGRTQIFREVVSALHTHTQNEPLITHALWVFLNLMNGSHENKEKFVAEHGLNILDSIARAQERNGNIATLVANVVQQVLKLQRVRTDLYAKGAVTMLGRYLNNFMEPQPLIATYRALHTFALHTSARVTIGHELHEHILGHLRFPRYPHRFYAVIGKLLLRLCLDDSVKAFFIENRAVAAVRIAMDNTRDHLASQRFFICAEHFLQNPPGSPMPVRPTVTDILLLQTLNSAPKAAIIGDPREAEEYEHMLSSPPAHRKNAAHHTSDESDSSGSEGEDSGSENSDPASDDDISAQLRDEIEAESPTHNDIGHETKAADEPAPPEPSKDEPTISTPPPTIEITPAAPLDLSLDDDPEMEALLKDIETSTSPTIDRKPSPIPVSGNTPVKHHRRSSRGVDSPGPKQSLDDSFNELDMQLEKLQLEDFGTRALDDLLDGDSLEDDHTNQSTVSADPDQILAEIEAIEQDAMRLDSMVHPSTKPTAPASSQPKSPSKTTPPTAATTNEMDDELDAITKDLELDLGVTPRDTEMSTPESQPASDEPTSTNTHDPEPVETLAKTEEEPEITPSNETAPDVSEVEIGNEPQVSGTLEKNAAAEETNATETTTSEPHPETTPVPSDPASADSLSEGTVNDSNDHQTAPKSTPVAPNGIKETARDASPRSAAAASSSAPSKSQASPRVSPPTPKAEAKPLPASRSAVPIIAVVGAVAVVLVAVAVQYMM